MAWYDGLIGAVGSLAGGLFGQRSQESAGNKNAELQRDFAQQGVRWRVEDAKAAGIHPVAALGFQGSSASPAYVGDTGAWAADAGQNIQRAYSATRTDEEKALAAVELRNAKLQGDFIEQQILESRARVNAQSGPAFPSTATAYPIAADGIVSRDLVTVKPSEVISARSSDPSTEAGPAGPAYKEHDLGWLGKWKLLGDQASQGLEDMEVAKYAATIAANMEKFGFLKNLPANLVLQWINRPEWVDRMARREGARTMIPYYKPVDGGFKLFWRPV